MYTANPSVKKTQCASRPIIHDILVFENVPVLLLVPKQKRNRVNKKCSVVPLEVCFALQMYLRELVDVWLV